VSVGLVEAWRRRGTIGRAAYLLVGLFGFALKHLLDRLVAAWFHRDWALTSYWVPMASADAASFPDSANGAFFLTLLVVALPFIWLGVVLTLWRLRDSGLPPALVVLFFFPYFNLLLFTFLCAVPSRDPAAEPPFIPERGAPARRPPWLTGGRVASGALAGFMSVVFGMLAVLVLVMGFGLYSWSLFVGTPFCMGLIAALVHGTGYARTIGDSILIAVFAPLLLGAILLIFRFEGVICLLMAVPVAIVLSLMGALIGCMIQRFRGDRRGAQALLLLVLIGAPVLMGADRLSRGEPPLLLVTTSVDIDAPPGLVWRSVVSFPDIPAPREWLFRAGIAYPLRAVIEGEGPGALRHCVFSTGEFLEPIEVWDEPRVLEFSVQSNPVPMTEWTPYSAIDAPHLEGYFVANRGRFRVTPLPGGRTRLEGSTWYRNAMWPVGYWRLWSDAIVHRIHTRVLEHIRDVAESGSAQS
jgi:hypothetical protein